MNNNCCVYVLNENPIYNAMFSVSIRTFRKHNPKIPITLFYVNDSNKDSWEQTNKLFKEISPEYTKRFMLFRQEDIFSLVKNLDINLIEINDLPYKSQNYVSIQRCIFENYDFDDAILLDVDTFCFRSIDFIFEKYSNYDFVACPLVGINNGTISKQKMRFIYFDGDNLEKQTLMQFNSGVDFWKGNLLKEYGKQVLQYCNNLLYKKHPMSDMMYALREDGRNREEVACNLFVLENKIKNSFFDTEDVSVFEYSQDLAILHSTSSAFPYLFSKLAFEGKLVEN